MSIILGSEREGNEFAADALAFVASAARKVQMEVSLRQCSEDQRRREGYWRLALVGSSKGRLIDEHTFRRTDTDASSAVLQAKHSARPDLNRKGPRQKKT